MAARTGSAAAGLRPASAHGGAPPVTRGPARPQRVVRGERTRPSREGALTLGPRARVHQDPALGTGRRPSPALSQDPTPPPGPPRPALALETPAGSRAGPPPWQTRAASSLNRDSRISAERQSLLAPSQAPRWWREAVTPMSGLGEASCRPACPQIRTGQGRSLPGRGQQDRSRWAGRPRLARGQRWMEGGGWGCSQNGGGRGLRGPAIGQGRWMNAISPQDLEILQVTRKRACF